MTVTPDDQPLDDAAARAETIAAGGDDVREKVRRFVVDTVRERRLELDRLGALAEKMIGGAVAGVRNAAPDRSDSVLRDVIDGLGDGLSASAHATRLALEEARGRGETFAKEDLEKAVEDLRTLEGMLVDTVTRVGRGTSSFAGSQAKTLVEHAKRTAAHVRPSIESALAEAVKHPVKMTTETAATAAKAVPQAAGTLLRSMSGLLLAASDLLTGEAKDEAE